MFEENKAAELFCLEWLQSAITDAAQLPAAVWRYEPALPKPLSSRAGAKAGHERAAEIETAVHDISDVPRQRY